jgi:hypothetical protein
MNIRGVDYPVTATALDPDDVDRIIDFKPDVIDGERVSIISKKSFRNIYADPVPVVPRKGRKESRETRGADMAYMREIILLGDDDGRYQELTPIEVVIYNFLSEYFEIDDEGTVQFPKQEFINRVGLNVFYLSATKKGVTEKDFLSVLFNYTPDWQTGCLTLRQRMFSSDKIREWNAINSFKSIISANINHEYHPGDENQAEAI